MTHETNAGRSGPDATLFCERLAERLQSKGVTHPVAAAVALTARGSRGVDIDQFASTLGVDAHQLRQAEAGNVAFVDLPDDVAYVFARIPSASLFLVAYLEPRMSNR